jgi:hypothetical protein
MLLQESMIYQLGWTTLPGLRGLCVSEFRATPTASPDNETGVAVAFEKEADRDAFLHRIETEFASRRFTNAADAFDTVKAWIQEQASKRPGGGRRDYHQ